MKCMKKWREYVDYQTKQEMMGDLCCFVYMRSYELQDEIDKLLKAIKEVRDVVESYDDKNKDIIMGHCKYIDSKINKLIWLKILIKQLKMFDADAPKEFFCEFDFLNFVNDVLKKEDKYQRIVFVWKSQYVVENIKFQLERFCNTHDKSKQIAILRGMIAM